MEFAPLHGWLPYGPQHKQGFKGWKVLANKPHPDATPVVVLTKADYDALVAK